MVVLMTAQIGLCGIYSQLAQIAIDLIDDYGLDEDPKTSALPADANIQSPPMSTHSVLIPSAATAAEGSLALGAPLKVTCVRCRVGEGLIKATRDLATWCAIQVPAGTDIAINDLVCRGCIPPCRLCNATAGLYAASRDFVTSCADHGQVIAVKDLICQTCIVSHFKNRKCCACGTTKISFLAAGSHVISTAFLQQHDTATVRLSVLLQARP